MFEVSEFEITDGFMTEVIVNTEDVQEGFLSLTN